ncbi:MAG: translocation/assembly module TamB domain-containing protein [Candidatus Paracaedibacteraceae bacterium]|nr:translocation/assembly module TamB domain-containing protein [Candidatus Paracaedibacteraceae bacterium]
MMRIITKVLKYILAIIAVLLLVLQIPSLNTRVIQGVLNIATPSDLRIRIKGISGAFPFNLRINQIKLKDSSKTWFEINNLSFDWRGVDVLYGKLHFGEVHAERVVYLENPDMESSDDPLILPRLNIDKLRVNSVEIPMLYRGKFTVNGVLKSPEKGHQIIRIDLNFSTDYKETETIIYEQKGIDYTIKSSINRPLATFTSLSPSLLTNTQGKLNLHMDLAGQTTFKGVNGSASLKLSGFHSPELKLNDILGGDSEFLFTGNLANKASNAARINLKLKDRHIVVNVNQTGDEFDIVGSLKSSGYTGQLMGNIKDNIADIKLVGTGGHANIRFKGNSKEILSLNVDFKKIDELSRFLFYPMWGAIALSGVWDNTNKRFDMHAKSISTNGKVDLFSSVEGTVYAEKNHYKAEVKAHNEDVKIKIAGFSDLTVKNVQINELYIRPIYDKSRLIELKQPIYIKSVDNNYLVHDTEIHFLEGGLRTKNLVLSDKPTGEITLKDFDARILNSFIEGTQWRGMLEGNLVFGGKNLYDAKIAIKDFGLESGERKKEKLINIDLTLVHNKSSIFAKLNYTDNLDSKLAGSFNIKTDKILPEDFAPITTSLSGIVNISALNTLVWWGDRFKGKLTIGLKGDGTLKSSNISGRIALDDGYYENGVIGTTLKEIKARMALSQGILSIQSFDGKDYDKGAFGVTGKVNLQAITSPVVDLNLKLNKVMIANTHEAIVVTSGNLTAKTVKAHHHIIAGAITVNSALINLNQVSSEPKTIRVYRTTEELERKQSKKVSELLTQLDIKVDIPKKLFVQGFGLRSEWKGAMAMTGPMNIPNITGGIHSLKGRLDISSKRLELAPSSVTFETKHGQIMPVLDVSAKKVVREYEAFISVKGPVDEPKIDFISIPAQTTENVIALILFDKPLSEVTAAQSLQLATTLAAVKAGKFSGGALDSLNQLLGVDDISLNKQESIDGTDDNSKYSVSVGKQLTERVFVGLEQGIQQEVGSKVKVKVDVTKNTKVDAEVGTQNTALGYGLEFRY